MKMTRLQLFGLELFSAHVYGRSQLVAFRSLGLSEFKKQTLDHFSPSFLSQDVNFNFQDSRF